MKSNKIFLLGVHNDLYSKSVVKAFQQRDISFKLILVKPKKSVIRLHPVLNKISSIIDQLHSGRYKALSKTSLYTYKLFLRSILFNRSKEAKNIILNVSDIDLESIADFIVPDINHVMVDRILKDEQPDIGILSGVGLVHKEIIDRFSRFCLNGHPAPLPQCRGGGAVQFTLFNNLVPSASIHYATPEIDAGKILIVKPLELKKDDTIESISMRLTMHTAELIALVAEKIIKEESLMEIENNGNLNYWKNCTKKVQKTAEKNLKYQLRQL